MATPHSEFEEPLGWDDLIDDLNRQSDETRFLQEHPELHPQMLNLIKQTLSDFAYAELMFAEPERAADLLTSAIALTKLVYPKAESIR